MSAPWVNLHASMETLKTAVRNSTRGNNIKGFVGMTGTHITVKLDSLLNDADLTALGTRSQQSKKQLLHLFGITILVRVQKEISAW